MLVDFPAMIAPYHDPQPMCVECLCKCVFSELFVPKLLSVISEHLGRSRVKSVGCHYVMTRSADKVMSISDIADEHSLKSLKVKRI